MSIFSDVTADYFAAEKRVTERRRRDEPLGFGVDLALLTPYVLAVSYYSRGFTKGYRSWPSVVDLDRPAATESGDRGLTRAGITRM